MGTNYIKRVTIYGERCSGTNYLEELLVLNFDVKITWDYGWKHFFGFHDLTNSDDTLFIGIIRNLEDWINSLYREQHHLPPHFHGNVDTFLTDTFYSMDIHGNEIMIDRNIDTGERYKNIYELRLVKNRYLIETLPNLVKNYGLITYDELIDNFLYTMIKLKNYGLKCKDNVDFPLNVEHYKQNKGQLFIKKENYITKEKIIVVNDELIFFEKLLFPKKSALNLFI